MYYSPLHTQPKNKDCEYETWALINNGLDDYDKECICEKLREICHGLESEKCIKTHPENYRCVYGDLMFCKKDLHQLCPRTGEVCKSYASEECILSHPENFNFMKR